MYVPQATARLQLHKDFTLEDAAAQAGYLHALGISHLYLSPITTAMPGSTHGYNVTDHTRVNPELGGEPALEFLSQRLRPLGMGLIIDIVSNHMAASSPENGWWTSMLQNGRGSLHAATFDIDWDRPGMRGKVLLPVLGRPYAEALAGGDISLVQEEDGSFGIRCGGQTLPLSPESEERICAGSACDLVQEHDVATPEGRARLHELLEEQHYRLAWWRTGADAINWRRFFEISDLAGVRVERPEVFDAVHDMVLRLFRGGRIDGLRVDHVDGLADPAGYCRKLRQRLDGLASQRPADSGRPYLIVEKILEDGENLRGDWGVDGTTGYDFMSDVCALLHDRQGEAPLTTLWNTVDTSRTSVDAHLDAARQQMMTENLYSEFKALCDIAGEMAAASVETRDVTPGMLRRALAALLCHFRVYRTYIYEDAADVVDANMLGWAVEAARHDLRPGDHPALLQLEHWLTQPPKEQQSVLTRLRLTLVTRFQQLTSPLAAKSLEDTVFYRYGRLLSRNEVGSDPAVFSLSVDEFHERMQTRVRRFPDGMLATATHDCKRGEDARARLAVLSEMPHAWAESVNGWLRSAPKDKDAPDAIDRYMLYQTLVGAWPYGLHLEDAEGMRDFVERVQGWQTKALREAKRHSNWSALNDAYEAACRTYLDDLLRDAGEPLGILRDIAGLVSIISPAGAVNSLSQTLARMTAPGLPDLYQGTECWDFSLVDPDNRRPVDYPRLHAMLDDGRGWTELLAHWRDGGIKQALIRAVLTYRRDNAALFRDGDYLSLPVYGAHGRRAFAFLRQLESQCVMVVATRLSLPLLRYGLAAGEALPLVPAAQWKDTAVVTDADSPAEWKDILTGTPVTADAEGAIPLKAALARLPVALLVPA